MADVTDTAVEIARVLEKAMRNDRTLAEAVQHLLDIGVILPNPMTIRAPG